VTFAGVDYAKVPTVLT